MKRLAYAALVALVLAACAPPGPTYDQTLDGWVGAPESALLSAWGQPAAVQDLGDGGRILSFERERTVVRPSGASATGVSPGLFGGIGSSGGGVVGLSVGVNPMVDPVGAWSDQVPVRCLTQFRVGKDGIVESWRWQGAGCAA